MDIAASTDAMSGLCRHANLPAFSEILLLSRCVPTIPRRIMKSCVCRIIKNSTFFVNKCTLASSKCAKTWSAGALPWTLLGSLDAPPDPLVGSEGERPSPFPYSLGAFSASN